MCGIAGYCGRGDNVVLKAMNDSLTHRGPDDSGEKVFSGFGGKGSIGIAQRRLSIIDLSLAGHQPMANEREDVWVVFNGEIYNFEHLRSSLEVKHTFRGRSDTEVILHLYEEVGEEVFSKLEGMFAIALYDSKKEKLYLARDRMGKKPLYWSIQDGTFLFGSELKALMSHPIFKRDIDLVSLNKYFQYEYIPTPHSIFKNTWKLEPGTYLEWDGKEAKKTQFWKPTFLPKNKSFLESKNNLEKQLEAAVEKRLVADVPVGVFLSGGIDSSAVAYYASKKHKNIKTFAIGFTDKTYDESAYARQVAEHLNTNHQERVLSPNNCIELIPEIISFLDEPIADASIVPTYFLSKFAREQVTVALSGDGGDELFFGYDTFLAYKFVFFYKIIPRFVWRLILKAVSRLPTSHKHMSFDFRLKRFVSGFDSPLRYLNQKWISAFNLDERKELFNQEYITTVGRIEDFEDIDRYLDHTDSKDKYDLMSLLFQRMFMMDYILAKVDRVSMKHALEVRSPFLDTSVVDIANHMQNNFKLKGLKRKYILKKILEGKLPYNILYRKKIGFNMPIGPWMKSELKPLLQKHLDKKSLDKIGFFNTDYVEKIIREHVSGIKDNRKQLWTLLVFVLWWKRWISVGVKK